MSKVDRLTLKSLRTSYRHHADPVHILYENGDVQAAARGILSFDIEMLDEEGNILFRGDSIRILKSELDSKLEHGCEITFEGEAYLVGTLLKDNKFESVFEIVK